MSACRRKYSELGIVQIPCALPCNAQRFVRFLIDINFFWRECGPLGAALWGSSGGLRKRRNCPGVRTNNALRWRSFDQGGFRNGRFPERENKQ